MKKIWLYLILLVNSASFSQVNLVPNPSFEIYDTCPDNTDQMNRAQGWSSYGNSPDYFNACGTPFATSVPNNGFGYQYGASGVAYSGFCSYSVTGYREYLGRSLSQALVINQKYFVSIKVNRPNYSNGAYPYILSNKLGVRFSIIENSYADPITPNNFAHVYTDSIISDTLNWIIIKGSFIADSSYAFISIGNFFDNLHTDTLISAGANLAAYYFLDDICVSTDSLLCSVSNSINENIRNCEINIFPNPVARILNIEENCSLPYILTIYTDLGQLALHSNRYNSKEIIDFNKYPAGIYYLIINQRNNLIKRKIIKIN